MSANTYGRQLLERKQEEMHTKKKICISQVNDKKNEFNLRITTPPKFCCRLLKEIPRLLVLCPV